MGAAWTELATNDERATLEGELNGRKNGRYGFARRPVRDQPLQHSVCRRRRAQFEIGAGNQAERAVKCDGLL